MSTKAQVQTQAKMPAARTAARIPQPPVPVPEHEADRPDITTQLEGAARLGHSLGAISVRSATPSLIQPKPLIQRQELPEEEEEEELQLKREPDALQRQGLHGGPVAPHVAAAIQRATGDGAPEVRRQNRTGLPDNLKLGLEHLSDLTMDDVRVHYNSSKPAGINAHAFTQGKDIHIASGQETHLPHEGWHVVQQAQGRVKPTAKFNDQVDINDAPKLETEASVMGAKALSDSLTTDTLAIKAVSRGNVQMKSTSSSKTVQRWIMMGKDLDLGEGKLINDIEKTSSLFEQESKKPISENFVLLSKLEFAKKKVAKALEFLEIRKYGGDEFVTIKDVEGLLGIWLGVVPEKNVPSVKEEMTDEVLGPKSGPDQYEIRAKAATPAEMRYYVTFEELAWALVQASGLQAPLNLLDTYDKEIAVAQHVAESGRILKNLKSALSKIFTKVAKLEIDKMKGAPDYATFHGMESWTKFKENYEKKFMPDNFLELITFLHDIKSYFAISKHEILSNKPEDIVVKGKKKSVLSVNEGDSSMDFPEEMRITKEDMRYNLGTVDEADDFVLFMRERGRTVWAAPSFTTVAMLEIVKKCEGSKDELTSVAYGTFAFWCIKYPRTATPIHTFHEVMAAAQAYGVTYAPDNPVVTNANNAIQYK